MRSPSPLALSALLLCCSLLCSVLPSLAQSSTGTSSSTGVTPYIETFATRYPIDWSVVPDTQAALAIASNEELGPCICDLTVGNCDVNCDCDTVCTATEITRFSASLEEGPVESGPAKCMDADLVRVNSRGQLTVELVNNMICVTENNSQTAEYLNPPLVITDAQFSAAKAAAPYLYVGVDPLALEDASSSTTDTSYLVDGTIKAAHADLTASTTTYYTTGNGVFVVPDADGEGECADGNSALYDRNVISACRRTVTSLVDSCVSGGILSATRYISNIKVGMIRTASPALPAQYAALNMTSLYYLWANGTETYLGADNSTASSFTIPEPTWVAATCECQNVLSSAAYTFTNEAAGTIASSPTPTVEAVITSLYATTCTSGAYIRQTFSTAFQLADVTLAAGVVVRPRSGNPGYVNGLPVLSGVLVSQLLIVPTAADASVTETVTRYSIAQDVAGLTVLPTTSAGLCSTSASDPTQPISFGQDSKFACYLPLTLAELKVVCDAGATGVSPYFGNISTSVGIWGGSNFTSINQWLDLTLPTAPTGVWNADTRTCAGLATSLTLDFATVDAGSFENPQRRIIGVSAAYTATSWKFGLSDSTTQQLFPVFVAVNFIQIPVTGLTDYVPPAPPLLPKFPSDLLYPLYIESSAATPTTSAPAWLAATIGMCALLLAQRWAA